MNSIQDQPLEVLLQVLLVVAAVVGVVVAVAVVAVVVVVVVVVVVAVVAVAVGEDERVFANLLVSTSNQVKNEEQLSQHDVQVQCYQKTNATATNNILQCLQQ